MKAIVVMFAALVLVCSCANERPAGEVFTIEKMNRMTPVKDQGRGPLCWIYAMLATVEGDRLAEGDSVNLSAVYVARSVVAARTERSYLSAGREAVTADGTAADALAALCDYGVMPYDAYRSDCNFNVLCRKLTAMAKQGAAMRVGISRLRDRMAYVLDTAVNPVPPHVWLYGAEYTPRELAASLCDPSEYVAMTSFTHEPMGGAVPLGIPANHAGRKFVNVPVDTLAARVERALRAGLNVCWEGDTSNAGFSFERGVAHLEGGDAAVTQAMRQRAFERLEVTDDHAMTLVGLARDSRGRRYFVCKNSWGTDNPYGGLMFMSLDYFRMNTVAVVMKSF